MTAPVKYSSKGGSLLLSIASVFTAVGACDTINAPDPDVEDVDATALDGPVGRDHEPTGYTEPGMAGGSCFFDPANAVHKAITAYLAAPAISSWKLTYPDVAPTSWTWSAIVKKFSPKLAVGQFLKADFSMQVTGGVTGW